MARALLEVNDGSAPPQRRCCKSGGGEEDQLMSAGAKHQIIRTLDDLPEPSLAAVAEFVDYLRAKAVAAPAVPSAPKEPRPYGLCAGEFTTPDDFDAPLPDEILDAFEGK